MYLLYDAAFIPFTSAYHKLHKYSIMNNLVYIILYWFNITVNTYNWI